ncbi:TetR/AcrR family transcriptional regulator [Phenylobacterium sp.]|uniref:TetR/AcrR family transcriptional regulator n=1 Tax=Phenylobacterium sp. TaxID=1871053 RepID=UPI002FC64FFD
MADMDLEAGGQRRAPAQQRSRERLERILRAATELIAAKGSDQLKMSEVAERAGISIGSLYQYFPEKSAIIRTLAERYNAENRRCIQEALVGVRDLEGLKAAYLGLIDLYYEIMLAEPVMRDIWSGMQADKQLVLLELAESRAAGAMLAEVMARVHPDADPEKIATSAFLTWHLGEATMRLAISLDRAQGRALVEAHKRMTLREILEP